MTFLKFLLASHLFLVHFVLNSTWIICMCWDLWKPHSFDAMIHPHNEAHVSGHALWVCYCFQWSYPAVSLAYTWCFLGNENEWIWERTTTKRWSNYMACTWRCLGNKKGENLGRYKNKNVKLKLPPILLMRSLLSIVRHFSLNWWCLMEMWTSNM